MELILEIKDRIKNLHNRIKNLNDRIKNLQGLDGEENKEDEEKIKENKENKNIDEVRQELFNWLIWSYNEIEPKIQKNYESKTYPFTILNEEIFESKGYKEFIDLFDNYLANRINKENDTDEEIKEIERFLDVIFDDIRMKRIYEHFNDKFSSYFEMRNFIRDIWFKISDNGYNCLFEHVFIGEYSKNKVTGYHNWIKLYLDTKLNTIEINEFKESGALANNLMVEMKFIWEGKKKSLSSIILGISPILEFIIKSFAILIEKGDIVFDQVKIKVARSKTRNGKQQINTIYFYDLNN